MPVHSFIHSLGSIGVFPSRAFLPTFVAALVLRFGDFLPFVAQAGLAGNVHTPSWFTCNTSLVIVGILSCLECWASKNSDVRELLDQFACFAVLSVQWIPFLGIGSLPIMAAINYVIYRRAFGSAWRATAFAVQPSVRSNRSVECRCRAGYPLRTIRSQSQVRSCP